MSHPESIVWGSVQAQEVFVQARAGCVESREQLFDAARAYLRIAARNAIDSDIRAHFSESDLVQETLLAADRAFPSFQGESQQQFGVWLRRILLNTLLNRYRAYRQTAKRDRSQEQSIDAGQVPPENLATNRGESPSQQAIVNEEQQLLSAAIAQLPDDYQKIITMRHRDHMTFAQIGAQLNRSPDAARMLWYRAFQQLSNTVEAINRQATNQARGSS